MFSPKKTAWSPETHGERVVPLSLQKLSVPQMPLPDWKPAAVEVSQVTVAAGRVSDERQAAQSRRVRRAGR